MKHIKNSLLVIVFTFSTVLFAQQRGGRGNSSHQQGQGSQMAEAKINPQNMAGIIMYDSKKVVKKLKIKEAPLKTAVTQAISKYNNKINEIKTFNNEAFNDVNKFLTHKRSEAMQTGDFSAMKESRMQANKMLAPIRKKVVSQKNILNTTLEKELSEKQYTSWIKYQEGELKKLNPNTRNNQQNQGNQQRNRNSGQQQGMRRGGY